jgi:hypothetical protein
VNIQGLVRLTRKGGEERRGAATVRVILCLEVVAAGFHLCTHKIPSLRLTFILLKLDIGYLKSPFVCGHSALEFHYLFSLLYPRTQMLYFQ